ncbi:MAG TPA: hypothetical protein VGL98_03590 [Gammaproteobacteria bacterium]
MSETVSTYATFLLATPRFDAASAAYDAIADAHGSRYVSVYVDGVFDPAAAEINASNACLCGRVFTTANGRGLHIGAMKRAASRAFDAAIAR